MEFAGSTWLARLPQAQMRTAYFAVSSSSYYQRQKALFVDVCNVVITAWDSEQLLRLPSEEADDRQRCNRPRENGQREPPRNALVFPADLAHVVREALRGEVIRSDDVTRRIGVVNEDAIFFRFADEGNDFWRHNFQCYGHQVIAANSRIRNDFVKVIL
jgi:hypothetical protein